MVEWCLHTERLDRLISSQNPVSCGVSAMAKHRKKCSCSMTILVMVGVAGLVTLILQKYAYSHLSSQQEARQKLRQKVQHLREEGAPGFKIKPDLSKTRQTVSHTKVILMHSFPHFYELKSGHGLFSSCNDSCILTLDPELSQEVDSVVMYSHYYQSQIPPSGSPKQIWVYFAVESPQYSASDIFGKPAWHNRFNWTMTYRRDSDFYFGYGDVVKPPSPQPKRDFATLVNGKSKMVAWFLSNCNTQSKRGDFAAALKEFIEVDIYGSCGNLKCDKEGSYCLDMLSKDYYFYLSFENSLCKDYITEKLYSTMKKIDIVPVVRGGANYTALLPKNSFIDVSQFPSIKALADHLKRVAGDKKVYESYLAWKNEWQVIEPIPFSFCEFCHRLHHPDHWAKVYPNVDDWWRQGTCHDPPAIIKT